MDKLLFCINASYYPIIHKKKNLEYFLLQMIRRVILATGIFHLSIIHLLLSTFHLHITAKKIPTTANIDEYNDPLLEEVFRKLQQEPVDPQQQHGKHARIFAQSTHEDELSSAKQHQGQKTSNAAVPLTPLPIGESASAIQDEKDATVIDPNIRPKAGTVYKYTNPFTANYQNAISNERTVAQIPHANNENNLLANPLADLAFQTGQNIYFGIRQAGHLLGIDAGQYQPYEIPVISEGARFFGRKRR